MAHSLVVSIWGVSISAPKELVCCVSIWGPFSFSQCKKVFPFLFDNHRTFRGLCYKMEEDFLLSVNPKPIVLYYPLTSSSNVVVQPIRKKRVELFKAPRK
jgi:hypothetical protein